MEEELIHVVNTIGQQELVILKILRNSLEAESRRLEKDNLECHRRENCVWKESLKTFKFLVVGIFI